MKSRTIAILIILMSVSVLAASSALVVVGKWYNLFGPRLSAEIQLHEVAVPETFKIDPALISDEIVSRMNDRTESDVALRILLNAGQNELVRDRVIPRLVNAGVIRRMLRDMEGLGTIIEFESYKAYAQIRIENRNSDALSDVALTLPHARRVESLNEVAFEFRQVEAELGAVSFPFLQAGDVVELKVWMDAPPAGIVENSARALLGADGGVRGEVFLYGATSDWNGADLEVLLWARWLVALFCVAIAFGATAAAFLLLVANMRKRPASGALDLTDPS